jgi:hypothetical protein
MRRNKDAERKSLPPRILIPLVMVGSILALLSGLTLEVAKNNIEARATLAAIYPTLTQMADNEEERAQIIRGTATALPPNNVNPNLLASSLPILPDHDSLCSATVLRVEKVDHDQDPQTQPVTLLQAITIWHCVNSTETKSLAFQIPDGKLANAEIVDVTPLGEPPIDTLDPSEPATLILAMLGEQYYDILSPLDGMMTLADGTNLAPGTSVSYCGFNADVNEDSANYLVFPLKARCDTTTHQGYDEYDLAISVPAAIGGGDSGGAITIAGTNQIVSVISSNANIHKYGPDSLTAYSATIPSIGNLMAEIQWELGQTSMQGR